ncbi:MAG TPA: hypothetical protein VGX21_18210 [Methylomirabilota bacterium]|jgi:hypothetical protein|nr:hypothetical protein [Methylomirabilota bacterium]
MRCRSWWLLAAALALAVPAAAEEDEEPAREVYVPHPEFRAYGDLDQLTVEGVTLIRVRRPDQSEALVAREEAGWEHVVLDGFRLAFYSQAKQPLRRGPGRHVIVQDWSGGAHCCFDYYVLHVQGTAVRREGMIRAGDCDLRVADLDNDGNFELIGCDARFAYGFDLSFAESPLVPLVYTFRDRGYVPDNRRFPQVFRFRIARDRRRLAEAGQAGDPRAARAAAISLLLHQLYGGWVTDAWCNFARAYRWADRAAVRQEVLETLRKPPDPDDPRVPSIDLGYALAPPGRCG